MESFFLVVPDLVHAVFAIISSFAAMVLGFLVADLIVGRTQSLFLATGSFMATFCVVCCSGMVLGDSAIRCLQPPSEVVEVIPTGSFSFKDGRLSIEASFLERSVRILVPETCAQKVYAGTPIQARRFHNDKEEFFVCK